MRHHSEAYEELKKGDYQAPSIYLAAIKERIATPDIAAIRRRVEKVLQRDDVDDILSIEEDEDGFTNIVLRGVDEDELDNELVSLFRIRIYDNDEPEAWSYEAADYRNRNLLEDERSEMHSGESYTLPLDDVTDWCIYSTFLQARITPDNVFRLRRYLDAN